MWLLQYLLLLGFVILSQEFVYLSNAILMKKSEFILLTLYLLYFTFLPKLLLATLSNLPNPIMYKHDAYFFFSLFILIFALYLI